MAAPVFVFIPESVCPSYIIAALRAATGPRGGIFRDFKKSATMLANSVAQAPTKLHFDSKRRKQRALAGAADSPATRPETKKTAATAHCERSPPPIISTP